MATIGASVLTLVDYAKSLDPNGTVAPVIELLAQSNEILLDMLWEEGNLPTGTRTTQRTGLPTVYYRLLNQGVTPSKSTKAQIDEQCALLEAWSEVDKDVAELGGNVAATRLSEAQSFLEAMAQQAAATTFYGAATSPEQFIGLSTRYSSLSAGNSQNILDCGGTGSDNASMWLVVWGNRSLSGIYPKGSTAGLERDDRGLQTIVGSTGIGGTRMLGYQERFVWKLGIKLADWRYVVRACNIDVSNLVAESSAADLQNKMIRMIHRLPTNALIGGAMGRPAFYMNRTLFEMLDIQRRNDVRTGGQLNYEKVDGIMSMTFRGIPLRRVDQLLLTESRVT